VPNAIHSEGTSNQVYAASLMAIGVDTPAEKAYLGQLASGLGLTQEVTGKIEQMVGL